MRPHGTRTLLPVLPDCLFTASPPSSQTSESAQFRVLFTGCNRPGREKLADHTQPDNTATQHRNRQPRV